jgi:plastocyanin
MPSPSPLTTPARRVSVRLAAALLAAAALAACSGGVAKTGNVKSGRATGEAVKIEAGDNFFKPEKITLNPGDEVTVEITNAGRQPHDWTVDEPKISTGVMAAGEVANATFTVPDGDVKFVCTLHNGMDGTIAVS